MAQQTKTLFRKKPSLEYQGDIYQRKPVMGYCGVCGKKTEYKSVYAAEYCCSEECSRELWSEIFIKLHTDKRRRR